MPHLPLADAAEFTVHGVRFRSLARTQTGARELGAWQAHFPPHTPGRTHRMTHEEVLHVTAGELRIEIDGAAFRAATGDAALVPAGALLRVDNEGDAEAVATVVTRLGMRAVTEPDGAELTPPWAQ